MLLTDDNGFYLKKGIPVKTIQQCIEKNYISALYNYNACTIIFVFVLLFQVKRMKTLYFCHLWVDIEKERKANVETQIVHLNRKENFALKIVSVVFASFGFGFVEFWVSSARFPKGWNRFLWFHGGLSFYGFMTISHSQSSEFMTTFYQKLDKKAELYEKIKNDFALRLFEIKISIWRN